MYGIENEPGEKEKWVFSRAVLDLLRERVGVEGNVILTDEKMIFPLDSFRDVGSITAHEGRLQSSEIDRSQLPREVCLRRYPDRTYCVSYAYNEERASIHQDCLMTDDRDLALLCVYPVGVSVNGEYMGSCIDNRTDERVFCDLTDSGLVSFGKLVPGKIFPAVPG